MFCIMGGTVSYAIIGCLNCIKNLTNKLLPPLDIGANHVVFTYYSISSPVVVLWAPLNAALV